MPETIYTRGLRIVYPESRISFHPRESAFQISGRASQEFLLKRISCGRALRGTVCAYFQINNRNATRVMYKLSGGHYVFPQ